MVQFKRLNQILDFFLTCAYCTLLRPHLEDRRLRVEQSRKRTDLRKIFLMLIAWLTKGDFDASDRYTRRSGRMAVCASIRATAIPFFYKIVRSSKPGIE